MSSICHFIHEQLESLPLIQYPFDFNKLPDNGIYFFYEDGQSWGHGGRGLRITRIGTHRDGNFRSRIKDHYLPDYEKRIMGRDKPKPSDRSIFRKNLGRALLNRERDAYLSIWNIDFTARDNRETYGHQRDIDKERKIEEAIIQILRQSFCFRYIIIEGQTERMGATGLESAMISTVANCEICRPSKEWLGNYSPNRKIRESGLWLVQHLEAVGVDKLGMKMLSEAVIRTRVWLKKRIVIMR